MGRRTFTAVFLAVSVLAVRADDGSWGTSFREAAGPIYAETENSDISLDSEFLRFSRSKTGETEAFFLFRNTSAREVRLEAGFPVRVRIGVGRLETTPGGAKQAEWVLYPIQGKYQRAAKGESEMQSFYGGAMFVDKVPHEDDPFLPNPLLCVREKDAAVRRLVQASDFTDPFSFFIEQDGVQVPYDSVLLESRPVAESSYELELSFHFHHVLTFKPKAASVVRVGYFQDCMRGTQNRGYRFAEEYGWEYVLGTGRTWKGPIGRLLLALPMATEMQTELPNPFVSLGTAGEEQLFLAEDYEPEEEDEIALRWVVDGETPSFYYESIWFGDPPAEAAKPIMPAQYFVEVLGASSFLAEKTTVYTPEGVIKNMDFSPLRAFDGVRESAWCEAARDDGIGEWIDFDLSEDVDGLSVQNGFNMSLTAVEGKTIDTYYEKNNRVKLMEIASKDGKTGQAIELEDAKEVQSFDVNLPKGAYRLTIRSVYKGSKWNDTCLGELTFHPVNADLKELLATDAFLRERF